MEAIFNTVDTELKHLNGTEVIIIRVIDEPDKTHDLECLPMYVLNITHKGKNIEAFKDELELKNNKIVEIMNKGDFMRAVQSLDDNIKEMDSAVPHNFMKEVRSLGLDTTMFVMCYWKDGRQTVINVAQHWAELYTRGE